MPEGLRRPALLMQQRFQRDRQIDDDRNMPGADMARQRICLIAPHNKKSIAKHLQVAKSYFRGRMFEIAA